MGQYSQWLYHREIDHQLQERLETLAQELHALQEQAAQLEDAASDTDNPILQAIAMQQSARALLEDTSTSSIHKLPGVPVDHKKQPARSVSSALFGWSNLPNLDTQNIQVSATEPDTQQPEAISQALLIPRSISYQAIWQPLLILTNRLCRRSRFPTDHGKMHSTLPIH